MGANNNISKTLAIDMSLSTLVYQYSQEQMVIIAVQANSNFSSKQQHISNFHQKGKLVTQRLKA
jgi:competence transcription factor ComK